MPAAEVIHEHFIEHLAPIFGVPKNAKALALELARHTPADVGPGELKTLAERIVATRRQKGFPAASELIAAVKTIPPPQSAGRRGHGANDAAEELRAWYEANARAVRFLRDGPLARRAIAEGWAPALLDFATREGREPSPDEEHKLIASTRATEAALREVVDEAPTLLPSKRYASPVGAGIGAALMRLRSGMHEAAARKLTRTEAA